MARNIIASGKYESLFDSANGADLTQSTAANQPIATTVAGDDPETAAKSAHAITPARPSPPCQ